MAFTSSSVRPGDVISSALINYVLDKLDEIDDRVSDLEAGGGPSTGALIERFEPPTEQAIGRILTIHGRNLPTDPENAVVVDNVTVPARLFRPDNTSFRLGFELPTTIPVPAGGRIVVITVNGDRGSDQRRYKLLPEIPVAGDPPEIESVEPRTGSRIFVNEEIVINGANFAEDPGQNQIVFLVTLAGGDQKAYAAELTNEQIGESDTDTIVVTVPDIEEVEAGAGSRTVTLEVTVGAHNPASLNISVRRAL